MSELEKIVAEAALGDKKAFEEIYKLTYKQVYFTCMSFLKNQHDAEDVTHEVYVAVMKNLPSLKDISAFEHWLVRVAVNKCMDYVKKKKPIPVGDELPEEIKIEEDELFLPEEYITSQEKRKILMDIIRESLSDVLYRTVVLFYFNGFTIPEIAELMECPQGTVSYRLNSARTKLKKAVLRYEKDNGEKLYSAALVPVLALIFAEEAKAAQPADMCASIMTSLSGNSNVAAKVAKAGGKSMLKTLKVKIIAGVAGVVLVGGGITAAVVISNGLDDKNQENKPAVVSEYEDTEYSDNENMSESEIAVNDITDDEDYYEDEFGPEQLSVVENKVDAFFTALKEGDIDTLITLSDPESEATQMLEELKGHEYSKEMLAQIFENLAWNYNENDMDSWEDTFTSEYDSDEEYTDISVMYSVPAMLLFKELYLNTFEDGTLVSEKLSLSDNGEAFRLLQKVMPYVPMWRREYIDITIPDEDGNFYFIMDELFEDLYFDELGGFSYDLYMVYYLEELCDMSCDVIIGGDDSSYLEYDEEFKAMNELLKKKDFEGFCSWYDDYTGNGKVEEYAEQYGSYEMLSDSQKAWLDDYLQENVEYINVDYMVLSPNGEYRDGIFLLVYPYVYVNTGERGQWIIDNKISEFCAVYPDISDADDFSDFVFAYYFYMIGYAENYIE